LVATIISTILAIYAVIATPVHSTTGVAMDVAELYLAAAIYVPLALCFGIWGGTFGVISMAVFGMIPPGQSMATYSLDGYLAT
jgi:hypothetical protein